ncbi:GIY-YIG nuclease family protein [Mycolicibacterium fortuitum]|uniref:GIY-YIG nuclease family protein n=1 Tax=Mycolicibacterium fortuitum TaxID=1766 RepID=UPI0011302300|nr:GIY-YIG nuclease family protein [Mycolicibacterium fortuitum]TPW95705.1 GIY-YIG nuclease family protein [Mycolicibacterium fortuitum]
MRAAHVLYRIFDSDDSLLYVGATTNPALRFGAHSSVQPWWHTASKITLEHFPGASELAAAEVQAIRTEHPRFNRMHTDTPRATSVRRRKDESRVFQRADGMWTGSVELPSINGRRRQRRVYSSDRDEAMRKLSALQEAVATGELA